MIPEVKDNRGASEGTASAWKDLNVANNTRGATNSGLVIDRDYGEEAKKNNTRVRPADFLKPFPQGFNDLRGH